MNSDRRQGPAARSLETWESWVDEAIRGARDRGDFENLPGAGKPLNLERNPFAGDREAGFHVLKNADLMPYWMELDKELSQAAVRLETFRAQAVARLERLRARACASPSSAATPAATGRRGTILRWLRGPEARSAAADDTFDVRSVERERAHTRRQYLELAATFDKQIVEYNAALPDEIRWLERPRLGPEQAARQFDAACPAVTCLASEAP